jgi:hypothetical protein
MKFDLLIKKGTVLDGRTGAVADLTKATRCTTLWCIKGAGYDHVNNQDVR